MLHRVCATAVAVALSLPACGISDPSANREDTFSAMLTVGGLNAHTFSASKSGEFSVKITALSPDSNSIVGTGFGQASGGGCALDPFYQNQRSSLNRTAITGPIYQKGAYCIAVFDVGLLTAAQNYTLVVSHP